MKDCIKHAADAEYLDLPTLRMATTNCVMALDNDEKINDPYDPFYLCAMQYIAPMDLTPEVTSFSYRDDMRRCIAEYPGEDYVQGIQTALLKEDQQVRVLVHGNELMDCYFKPTATHYAEDIRCD